MTLHKVVFLDSVAWGYWVGMEVLDEGDEVVMEVFESFGEEVFVVWFDDALEEEEVVEEMGYWLVGVDQKEFSRFLLFH